MMRSSTLLLCILVTCSVWPVHGSSLEISLEKEEQGEISVEVGMIPGLCWACKWTLRKVKKLAGPDATSEDIRAVLLKACDQIGKLRSMCRGFVKKNLDELVEELSTTDDVRTICVNLRACQPKGLMDLLFYQNDEDPSIKITKF